MAVNYSGAPSTQCLIGCYSSQLVWERFQGKHVGVWQLHNDAMPRTSCPLRNLSRHHIYTKWNSKQIDFTIWFTECTNGSNNAQFYTPYRLLTIYKILKQVKFWFKSMEKLTLTKCCNLTNGSLIWIILEMVEAWMDSFLTVTIVTQGLGLP